MVGQFTTCLGEAGININDDPPGIKVYPISRLITTEEGKKAQFGIVLLSRPTATVTIPVSTSDVTEASVDVTQLLFGTTPHTSYWPLCSAN